MIVMIAAITLTIVNAMTDMLNALLRAELELPELLDNAEWQSLDVNYHKPHVERVWCKWRGLRVNLHRILPCEVHEALFHPHPWPSAVRVVAGGYWSAIGSGPLNGPAPTVAANLWCPPDSIIVMDKPDGWHLVAPPEVSLSLMVTAQPYAEKLTFKPGMKLSVLNDYEVSNILDLFKHNYA